MTPPSAQGESLPARTSLTLGAIPGATPDKWVSRWRDRYPDVGLTVDYFDLHGQLERILEGTVDVGYLRLRQGDDIRTELVHRVLLYREDPVVCAAEDHWIAAAERTVAWEEISQEPFFDPADMVPRSELPSIDAPQAGADLGRAERLALQTAASGAGLVLLPQSVARMLQRKDMVTRTVEGAPGFDTGLAWLRERDDAVIQEFIGVARGRRAGSGRAELPEGSTGKGQRASSGGKSAGRARRATDSAVPARRPSRQKPGSRPGRPPRGRRRPR